MYWPDDTTTGYFQLDRRLRTFALIVSAFHYLYQGKCKPIAIESGRRRSCEAADYLIHIAQNIKQKELRPEFWLVFTQRINTLKSIVEELSEINVKHHNQMAALLKKLSSWWLKTCNRPIIQKHNNSITKDN